MLMFKMEWVIYHYLKWKYFEMCYRIILWKTVLLNREHEVMKFLIFKYHKQQTLIDV